MIYIYIASTAGDLGDYFDRNLLPSKLTKDHLSAAHHQLHMLTQNSHLSLICIRSVSFNLLIGVGPSCSVYIAHGT